MISAIVINIREFVGTDKKEKELQDDLKEARDAIKILKESTKAANDSEYAMTWKLAYEK